MFLIIMIRPFNQLVKPVTLYHINNIVEKHKTMKTFKTQYIHSNTEITRIRNEKLTKIEKEIILPVLYSRDDENHAADLCAIKYRGDIQ